MAENNYSNAASALLLIMTLIYAFDFLVRLSTLSQYMAGGFGESKAAEGQAMFAVSLGMMALLMAALFFFATKKRWGFHLALAAGAVDLAFVGLATSQLMPDVNWLLAAVLFLLPIALVFCVWKSKPLFEEHNV